MWFPRLSPKDLLDEEDTCGDLECQGGFKKRQRKNIDGPSALCGNFNVQFLVRYTRASIHSFRSVPGMQN